MKKQLLMIYCLSFMYSNVYAETLICPLPSCDNISTPFVKKKSFITKKWRVHKGVDFPTKIGTSVTSISNGTVVSTGKKGGYGYTITIKHKEGMQSLYAHLSKILVKPNQVVKQSEIIAYSGNSGLSTGPHLHLGITQNNEFVNPLRLIRR